MAQQGGGLQGVRAAGLGWLNRVGALGALPLSARQWLARHHWWFTLGRPVQPRRQRFAGGAIMLNLHESPCMVATMLDLYEQEKSRALRQVLRPGMTFIDVGGNLGQFSLLAARLVGPRGHVISVEPAPANAQMLRHSAQANGYHHLHVVQCALGDAPGKATLHLADACGMHSLCTDAPGRDHGAVEVEVCTLDELVRRHQLPRVDAIKIDVEGFEMPVLRGARQTLQRHQGLKLFIDVHVSLGIDARAVARLLAELGCDTVTLDDPALPTVEVDSHCGELVAVARRRESNLAAVA
jgi:FkbM family methyltransferase